MILHKPTEVTRKLPLNFKEADLSLFAHELSMAIHETRLNYLQNVVVTGDGFLYQHKRIRPESFADCRPSRRRDLIKANLRRIKIGLKGDIKDLHKPAVWFTDQWSHMYFHWIMDALPRLFVAKDYIKGRKILLPDKFEKMRFVRESLHAFEIENELVFIPSDQVLRVEDLLIPSHTAPTGNFNEEIVQNMRGYYQDYYDNAHELNLGDKIYVSRAKAKWRKVINEDEVVRLLSRYGFEVIYYEDYSWAEKVAIGSNAKYLVSLHGAGLTNMLFMNDDSFLFEFRLSGDKSNNAFFSMASALNINYLYQICEGDGKDTHKANVHINIDELERNIVQMLAYDSKSTCQPMKG